MISRAFRIHKCVQQRDLSTDRLKFAKLFETAPGEGRKSGKHAQKPVFIANRRFPPIGN